MNALIKKCINANMYIFVHRVIYEAQRYKLSARFYQ